MPIQVTCPSCQTTLKTADSSAGKRAKCPKCGGIIEIPSPTPIADEYELESTPPSLAGFTDEELSSGTSMPLDNDRKPCPACGESISRKAVKCRFCGEVFDKSLRGIVADRSLGIEPEWFKVRGGLATLYYSIGVMFGAIVLMIIGIMLMGGPTAPRNGGAEGPSLAVAILMGVCGFAILGAAIGVLVGQVRCTAAPAESGAKGLANGAAICIALNILAGGVGGAAEIPALSVLGSLVSLIGNALFVLFIRKSASYLGDADLSTSAGRYLMFCVVAFFGAFGVAFLAGFAQVDALIGLVGFGVLIAGIVALVWFLRLVKGLMTTIDRGMSAR